jgi:hypothetical protein
VPGVRPKRPPPSGGVLFAQLGAALVVGIVLGVSRASQTTIEDFTTMVTIAGLVLMFAMLVPAAIYGSKSKKLREAAGIQWPKKKT